MSTIRLRLFSRLAAHGLAVSAAVILASALSPARAIIVTGNQGRNTGAPTGALADSGWQYEGAWNTVLGTAIAPHFFVTAAHTGGTVGDAFTLGGTPYTTIGETVIAGTDLAVWQVAGSLPLYAPLYAGGDEVGQEMIAFGRGVARGTVFSPNGSPIGWNWGGYDGLESWGTNQFDGVVNASGLGDLLTFSFNYSPNTHDTGILADGDSGGGVFVKDNDGAWKLAGVNYGIQPFYNSPAEGSALFSAAIYDARGLYTDDGNGGFVYLDPADYPDPIPQSAAASRISTQFAAINQIIGAVSAPEPSNALTFVGGLLGLASVARRRRKCAGAACGA